ncbi:MAG: TIGR03545 family protein [Gemmatimonadales bacterium]
MKLFRWRAIVPMVLFAGVVVLLWVLFVDHVIRRSIEWVGTELVGAKVELASARLRLAHADIVLKGLQVTDPQQPMRNLVEAPEIIADLDGRALLQAKVVVETLAVRGVKFGTARTVSGAIAKPSPSTGLVTTRVLGWARAIPIPTLDLTGMAGMVVHVNAISADSLKTTKEARASQALADSIGRVLGQTLRGLDPQPMIDSAQALATRLGQSDPRRQNPIQTAAQVAQVRAMIGRITDMKTRLAAVKPGADSAAARLRVQAAALEDARQADYRYARSLANIPALGGPDISMALFGRMVTDRLQPVLYWMNLADQYVPPGLDPRRSSGPKRARMAGTTFAFPRREAYPTFLLKHADADLTIGGQTVAAGSYRGLVTGATTEPAIYGRPMFVSASRTSGVGPHDLRIGAMMDRVGATARDSVNAFLPGVRIPAIALPGAGASLDLGDSTAVEVVLARSGGELNGVYRMTSNAVRWQRTSADTAGPAPTGSAAWAQSLLWRSISAVPAVTIEARISGSLTAPHLDVTSNVGEAVADNLRKVLGAEVQRAEAEARSRVDAAVGPPLAAAREKLTGVQRDVVGKLGAQQQQLDQLQTDLQQRLARLGQAGLPGLPGLPRP